jgi:hypothetical protein
MRSSPEGLSIHSSDAKIFRRGVSVSEKEVSSEEKKQPVPWTSRLFSYFRDIKNLFRHKRDLSDYPSDAPFYINGARSRFMSSTAAFPYPSDFQWTHAESSASTVVGFYIVAIGKASVLLCYYPVP